MLIVFIIVVAAICALAGYVFGMRRTAGHAQSDRPITLPAPAALPVAGAAAPLNVASAATERERIGDEKARIIRSQETEAASLRAQASREAVAGDKASDVAALEQALVEAHAETARYRQLVIDIENNAPPPILQGAAEPDDLKLIVGIGPVLERMLRNIGVTTFRQIARWTPREVADFDTRLPEFPGRIVRDQWVIQARALHESKYGESALGRPS